MGRAGHKSHRASAGTSGGNKSSRLAARETVLRELRHLGFAGMAKSRQQHKHRYMINVKATWPTVFMLGPTQLDVPWKTKECWMYVTDKKVWCSFHIVIPLYGCWLASLSYLLVLWGAVSVGFKTWISDVHPLPWQRTSSHSAPKLKTNAGFLWGITLRRAKA